MAAMETKPKINESPEETESSGESAPPIIKFAHRVRLLRGFGLFRLDALALLKQKPFDVIGETARVGVGLLISPCAKLGR